MGRRGNLLEFSREGGLETAFSGGRGCPWAKKAGRRERRALGPLLSSLFNRRRGAERPLHPGSDRLRGRAQRAVASAETALRLGKYFGLPAQFWMNLQAEHDLRLAAATAKLERVRVRTTA